MSAGEFRGDVSLDTDEAMDAAAAALRISADRLAAHGLLVAVEAFPWSAISTVGRATELVRRSGAPNAGLMIDVWHFYNSGADLEALQDLPGAASQPCSSTTGNGSAMTSCGTPAPAGAPGEGELDVLGLIRAVRRAGFDGPC